MTHPDLPDSLSDLDLARLLLAQERQRRVALQVELNARQHADAKREQEHLQRQGQELQAELCKVYGIDSTAIIDANTGAITRKIESNG